MELATVTLSEKELEHGKPVGIVKMSTGKHTLYENHDRGLSYYIGNKAICFMDMLDEENYEKVINEILKMQFTNKTKAVFQVAI
ncbi:hypothetical protein [Staphylococcus succinus]|uniref:hypothetical protein n=1 Tax=Staphylococcus succinus TaxID=61015 RepID=UPI000E67A7D5|nr:hypothetical protein [Staphylococcus succinus]RIN23984.1 hypothetical protein BU067_10905 [Staphylococcus succinus]